MDKEINFHNTHRDGDRLTRAILCEVVQENNLLAVIHALVQVTSAAAALLIETTPDEEEIWTPENVEKSLKHRPDFEKELRQAVYEMIVRQNRIKTEEN